MTNPWIDHIRQFAKKTNQTFGCALSDPRCSATYRRKGATIPSPPKEDLQDRRARIEQGIQQKIQEARRAREAEEQSREARRQAYQKEQEEKVKEREREKQERQAMGMEDFNQAEGTNTVSSDIIPYIEELAMSDNGVENLLYLYSFLLNDLYDDWFGEKKIYRSLDVGKTTTTAVPSIAGIKHYLGSSRLLDSANLRLIQNTLNNILSAIGSRFKISSLYWSPAGMGTPAGIRYTLKADFPPRTKEAIKQAEWENVFKTLKDMIGSKNKAFWVDLKERAREVLKTKNQDKQTSQLEVVRQQYRSKGIDIDRVKMEDVKREIKKALDRANITLSGMKKHTTAVSLLTYLFYNLQDDYKQIWDDFTDKLRTSQKITDRGLIGLGENAMGLIGEFLGKEAPKEVKRFTKIQKPKKGKKGKKSTVFTEVD
jgi:hypothetical protein